MSERSSVQIPSGLRAQAKRRAIVQAARRVFVRDGYDAGMDLISGEAGVSKMTVYNHFGSKEGLFQAVIGDALDEALDAAVVTATRESVTSTEDFRHNLILTARAWVEGMTRPDVVALRQLVVSEVRRFPELGQAWEAGGPERVRPALLAAFDSLIAEGRLHMPDKECALIQLYSLVLYPHLIHAAYGRTLDPELTEELITGGVDMFLAHYGYVPAAR